MLVRPPAPGPLPRATLALLLLAGCATAHGTARPSSGAAVPAIHSDEEFAAVRSSYDPFDVDARDRLATRTALERYQLSELASELAAGRLDAAGNALEKILPLWDAAELKSPVTDEELFNAAASLEKAFRRRGAHREVLTALAVELSVHPADEAARKRFAEVCRWLRGEDHPDDCSGGACQPLIEDLEASVALWPSPFLVNTLGALYKERLKAMPSTDGFTGGGRRLAALVNSAQRTGFDLVRLYLRVSRADKALAEARALAGQPGDDEHLRDALERYLSSEAKPMDALAVAAAFVRDPGDRPVGERVCLDAARRFPDAVEPQLCVGEVATQMDQTVVALRAYERARAINPTRRETWERLAVLHQAHLSQLVAEERTATLEAELHRVEEFHAEARKRFPQEPLATSLAGALFEVGRGFYNAGRVDDAARYLRRSLDVEPTPYAAEFFGVLELKRDRAPAAEQLLKDGFATAAGDRHHDHQTFNVYWLAKLTRDLGETYEQLGDAARALEFRRKSIDLWDALLKLVRGPGEDVAEAELERGKLLYEVGDKQPALDAMERAIDAAPERGATYADLLVFLVPRGESNLSLDAYHRALGRGSISEYLKVYCSLWIVDLLKRQQQPDDPLAQTFLAGVTGAKWYADLARWATGRATDADLEAHADTVQKKCELSFYKAMRALERGQGEEARRLWKSVIDTHLMAFFEYDMALFYLRHLGGGPSAVRASVGSPRPAL